MTTREKTACIIVAGGSGSRLGAEAPKQFLPLRGRPVLTWSVEFFGNHDSIDEVVVVVPDGWERKTAELLSDVGISSPIRIVAGGVNRQDSVLAGVMACPGATIVAIHDGARPFPPENLEEGLSAALSSGAAIFALPATDSIKLVAGELIDRTIPRANLWTAQTPQIFDREKLIIALEKCKTSGAVITDDASAFENMGWPVTIVDGSRLNIKITYPEDFILAEGIIEGRKK